MNRTRKNAARKPAPRQPEFSTSNKDRRNDPFIEHARMLQKLRQQIEDDARAHSVGSLTRSADGMGEAECAVIDMSHEMKLRQRSQQAPAGGQIKVKQPVETAAPVDPFRDTARKLREIKARIEVEAVACDRPGVDCFDACITKTIAALERMAAPRSALVELNVQLVPNDSIKDGTALFIRDGRLKLGADNSTKDVLSWIDWGLETLDRQPINELRGCGYYEFRYGTPRERQVQQGGAA